MRLRLITLSKGRMEEHIQGMLRGGELARREDYLKATTQVAIVEVDVRTGSSKGTQGHSGPGWARPSTLRRSKAS